MMDNGNVTGYICQGFNPVASFPDKNKVVRSLSKLKYMVVIDPLSDRNLEPSGRTTASLNDVDPSGDSDRSLPSAVDLLCRRGRFDRQLRPLAAVALERSGCQVERAMMAKSLPGFTIACANCTAPKAGRAWNPC